MVGSLTFWPRQNEYFKINQFNIKNVLLVSIIVSSTIRGLKVSNTERKTFA